MAWKEIKSLPKAVVARYRNLHKKEPFCSKCGETLEEGCCCHSHTPAARIKRNHAKYYCSSCYGNLWQ